MDAGVAHIPLVPVTDLPWFPPVHLDGHLAREFPHYVKPPERLVGNGRLDSVLDWDAPLRWCTEQFGHSALLERQQFEDRQYPKLYNFHRDRVWLRAVGTYCFRNPDNAFEFKMRWG